MHLLIRRSMSTAENAIQPTWFFGGVTSLPGADFLVPGFFILLRQVRSKKHRGNEKSSIRIMSNTAFDPFRDRPVRSAQTPIGAVTIA